MDDLKTSKQKLHETIEYLDDDKCAFLDKVIRDFATGSIRVNSLCNHAEIKGNFDYALPQPLVDRIRDNYPEFSTRFHIYDYSNNTFGEFKNVAEAFVINLQKRLSL